MLQHDYSSAANLTLDDEPSFITEVSQLDSKDPTTAYTDLNNETSSMRYTTSPSPMTPNVQDPQDSSDNELRFEDFQTPGTTERKPTASEPSKGREARSTTLTLKEQEKIIDLLKKENFTLKMKIYYLEEKMSPDQKDNALQENVDLKVNIQTLTHELKKYKKMILELHGAIDILQRDQKNCTEPHGMTEDEQAEYDTAMASSMKFRDENDQLRKKLADVLNDMAKLKLSSRSSHSSSPLPHYKGDEDEELWSSSNSKSSTAEAYHRKWLQAQKTIQEKNQLIQALRDENNHRSSQNGRRNGNYSPNDAMYVESLAAERQKLVNEVKKLQERLRMADTHKGKMQSQMNDLVQTLLVTKQQLRQAQQGELAFVDRKHEDAVELAHSLQRRVDELEVSLEQREQDVAALDEEVEKVVDHAEDLQDQLRERDELLEKLRKKLEQTSSSSEMEEKYEEEIQRYKDQLDQSEHEHAGAIADLEQQFSDLEASIQAKDEHIKEIKGELKSTLAKAREAKKHYEDDLKILETQFNDAEQTIKEQHAQITRLEHDLVAQTDVIQEEKTFHDDSIKEYEDKLTHLQRLLEDKENTLVTLRARLEQAEQLYEYDLAGSKERSSSQLLNMEDVWGARVNELKEHLREADRRLKRDREAANKALHDSNTEIGRLKAKLQRDRSKVALLNDLLDQNRRPSETRGTTRSEKSAQLLTRLNKELRDQLEEQQVSLEREETRVKELESLYLKTREDLKRVEQQLWRRDHMITRALEQSENDKERKEVLENVLRRQATEEIDVVLSGSVDAS